MPRVLRMLITGSAFVMFFSGAVVFGWLMLPIIGLFGWTAERRSRLRMRFMQRAYWLHLNYMRVTGLLHYSVAPRPPDFPPPGQPFVMISNHPSLIDVVHLMALFPGMASMAAPHYSRSLIMGRLLKHAGYIIVSRPGDQDSETAVLDTMVETLERGRSLLIFPEGTRSPLNGLRRFRRGAIEAAARAGVPIVPVFISQDPPSLMKSQRWYEVPYRKMIYEIEFFPIIHTQGRELDTRAVHKQLYARYKRRCQQMLIQRDENARRHGDPPMIDRSARPSDRVLGPAPGEGPWEPPALAAGEPVVVDDARA